MCSKFILPFIYVYVTYMLTMHTETTLQYVPKLLNYNTTNTVIHHIPKIPTNNLIIWKLAEIYSNQSPYMLEQASTLLNFKFNDKESLEQLVGEIIKNDGSVGLLNKIWGFMSFVNFLWIISIFGILITFIPCVVVLCQPFIELFITLFLFLKKHVDVIMYSILITLGSQAFHMSKEIGLYISITSLVGHTMLMYNSMMNYSEYKKHNLSNIKHNQLLSFLNYMLLIFPTVFLALHYNNRLLGFIAVMMFYSMIGFKMIADGLCYIVGFNNEEDLNKCKLLSLIVTILYIYTNSIYKHTNARWYLEPFYYGIYVFGILLYFLTLLISSSRLYSTGTYLSTYILNQQIMIVSLLTSLYISAVHLNNNSMYNVTLTFAVLYSIEKIGEMNMWKGYTTVMIFFFFVGLYCSALWLNLHPEFIMSIMNPI